VTVRLRDGVEVVLSDGTEVICDAARPEGDIHVVSHAHGDHTPSRTATAVCSPLTAALATVRTDETLHRTRDSRVTLHRAGHVAGSRAASIRDPDGTRYLYTGDICTRDRFYLEGFDPIDADVLVIEATYGEPRYVFPSHQEVVGAIREWLVATAVPVVLFGYALGRAQKLQLLAADADRDRIFTTPAVQRVNDVVGDHLDVRFPVSQYDHDVPLEPGDALILPLSTTRLDWIDDLVEKTDAITAGFSGWAIEDSFKYRGDFDVTFPLSDHCDYEELRAVVEAVEPETVYTHHGAAETLASDLTAAGYDATALRRNQRTLGDF
jgi:putative mRNA 3-end processing factor